MDPNHAMGCSLVGLALTTLLVRMVWMTSPPFNAMVASKLSVWKKALVVSTILMIAGGSWFLSQPIDPAVAARNAEEGFQFH